MPSQRPLNNRLHIVVNGQRLSGEPTGVGRYIEMVLIELQELIDPDQIDLVLSQTLDPVRSAQLRVRSQVVASGLPALIWENVALPRRTHGVTVLFAPSYTLPLAFRGKSVLSNLGIYESMPQTFPWWHRIRYGPLYRYSARQASVVIANSESKATRSFSAISHQSKNSSEKPFDSGVLFSWELLMLCSCLRNGS